MPKKVYAARRRAVAFVVIAVVLTALAFAVSDSGADAQAPTCGLERSTFVATPGLVVVPVGSRICRLQAAHNGSAS